MSTTPFQPKADQAEWRTIYDHLSTLNYGDTVNYPTLRRMLGRDVRGNRSPVYRAAKELEANDQKLLVAEPGVGYRIAEPDETVTVVGGRLKRARKQVRRASSHIENAPLRRMSPAARRTLADHEARISRLEDAQRRTARKVASHDEALEDMQRVLRKHGLQ